MDFLLSYLWVAPVVLAIIGYKYVLWVFGVIIIPDNCIGVVTKKFVIFGKHRSLPEGRIVALNGEAGFQAETRAPGLQFGLWPWQYSVEKQPFVVIPQGRIGLVESRDGDSLPEGRIIAKRVECSSFQDAKVFLTNGGQRGPQMDVLAQGSWRINPLLFSVKIADIIEIPSGKIGVVEAKDGAALKDGKIIAKSVDCDSFQNADLFMKNGGQRGPQMSIIPPGSYRINTNMFDVKLADVVDIPDNKVGVVTTREGTPLKTGEIAGPEVENHNMFQNPQAFIDNGGTKGLQEQVLQAGRYFINPRFATVEVVDMVEVPIAHVGVVISYVGAEGKDLSGAEFKHANLVGKGEKGVCNDVLDPGKYAINPYTHKIISVPTANVVLNWANTKSEAHKLDENLSTITVRSGDGFKFNLDVSQIIHIPRSAAPKVIAQFGSLEALVTQVLEPLIGNYFRNSAQQADVIDYLKARSQRQDEAKAEIGKALDFYSVGAIDTLIGDISPPEALMTTLTDRKIADQEKITYETQTAAQTVRQALEQATALASTQALVVDAERRVSIAEFTAKASIAEAKGNAESKTINAEADAKVVKTVGEAEASKVSAIGGAEAAVIKQKIESMDPQNYALVQVAQALAASGMKLVPDIVATGSGAGGGSLVDALLGNLLKDNLKSVAPKKEGPHELKQDPSTPSKSQKTGSETSVDLGETQESKSEKD